MWFDAAFEEVGYIATYNSIVFFYSFSYWYLQNVFLKKSARVVVIRLASQRIWNRE